VNLLAIETGSAITWGDLLIILAVLALILVIFGGIGRWRR
jgi:hypothetical protein